MDLFEKLKNPPKEYRPVPFWSWNEKLDAEETKRQIGLMNEAGIGGYFMHARGGLQTPYMGEEWFQNITAGIEEGKKLGMQAWAYDENGWPSGFGSGVVNGKGVKYQQKYLRMEQGEKQTDTTICNEGGYHFYYEVNPFYVDTLDASVIRTFIDEIYQVYYEKYKNELVGFFTDEPQISRNGIPWSFVMEETYQALYGESLLPRLGELFLETGDYKQTRFRFWKMVTKLFETSFMKQIYDWCEERGLKLTGHMVCEETLLSQLTSNGAAMPHYQYFHIPGMDLLCRYLPPVTTPLQVSSVAHQFGKKQVLSETFALCGWGVQFDDLKWIYEAQMVRGVTLLCPHLEGYSLRGIRKRDYPASLFVHQPWWSEYKGFVDTVSRIGMLLSEGKAEYDTLLIHPQSTAWIYYDNQHEDKIKEYNKAFFQAIDTLEAKHCLFHLGDETILEEHAAVENGRLVVGNQKYRTVVLPPYEVLFDSTKKLLEDFKAGGGQVVTAAEVKANEIIDNQEITYTKRLFDGFTMHYFVNSTDQEQSAVFAQGTKVYDPQTGERKGFDKKYTFPARSSLVVIDDGEEMAPVPAKQLKDLPLDGKWEIDRADLNALTLDTCTYWFDGQLQEAQAPVANIQHRACALKRPVALKMEYRVQVAKLPQVLDLVCETPEQFTITVNGTRVDNVPTGFYWDKAFCRIPIRQAMTEGDNSIVLETIFQQSSEVYANLEKSYLFESEKNKLTYDMEIESAYLVGDFGVEPAGMPARLEKDAVRYPGGFTIVPQPKKLALSHIQDQGFPFFAGSITLHKTMYFSETDYALVLRHKQANVVKITVNGQVLPPVLWLPCKLDLSPYLKDGKNRIQITLTNSLRNLLGPHHLESGESYRVAPSLFFKESNVWGSCGDQWNEGYCLLDFGIE